MRLLPKIQYVPREHEDIEIAKIEGTNDFLVKFGTYDGLDDTCRIFYVNNPWLLLQWIGHEFIHGLIARIPIIRLRLLVDWWWDSRGIYYDCDWSTYRWVWEEFTTACGPWPWFFLVNDVPDEIVDEFMRRHEKVYGPFKEEDLNTGDEIEE